MSANGTADTRVIDFDAPTAINTPVLGVEQDTKLDFLQAVSPNVVIRAIEDQPQSAAPQYEYDFLRDGKVVRTVPGSLMKAELPGPVWAPFPLTLAAGNFQIQMRQISGTLAGRKITIIFDHPLGQ